MGRTAMGAVVLGGLLGTGCLVQIDRVADPTPALRQARAEALRLQGRKGPAHELNVLVYSPEDQKLVRVSVPIWLCKKLEARIDWDAEGEDRAARAVRRHLRLEEIERAGLGLLVEAEEEDGEQVLVWLR